MSLRIMVGVLSILCCACASTYKPIIPDKLVYDSHDQGQGVNFGYRYEVLTFRGNRKYAKREPKKSIRLVALKIENTSGKTLKLGENFNLYSGQNQIFPMDPEMVHKELKQGVAIYLLYSLLVLTKTDCNELTGQCETKLIFPIGIPITIGNMVAAGSANAQFKMELTRYNLLDKEIAPGETMYALVGIPDTGFQPLKILLKD
jgi:hypothetical protein